MTLTPEQVAAADAYWTSREGRADRMAQRATRLHKLVKLRAPEVVIEQARRLMFDSLAAFPVDAGGSEAAERIDASVQAEESAFLLAHGYYDDVKPGAPDQGGA